MGIIRSNQNSLNSLFLKEKKKKKGCFALNHLLHALHLKRLGEEKAAGGGVGVDEGGLSGGAGSDGAEPWVMLEFAEIGEELGPLVVVVIIRIRIRRRRREVGRSPVKKSRVFFSDAVMEERFQSNCRHLFLFLFCSCSCSCFGRRSERAQTEKERMREIFEGNCIYRVGIKKKRRIFFFSFFSLFLAISSFCVGGIGLRCSPKKASKRDFSIFVYALDNPNYRVLGLGY